MKDSILWADYPSWSQFSWLYLMAGLMAGRAWLFWKFGFSGWIGWTVGAAVLLGTAEGVKRRIEVARRMAAHESECRSKVA